MGSITLKLKKIINLYSVTVKFVGAGNHSKHVKSSKNGTGEVS